MTSFVAISKASSDRLGSLRKVACVLLLGLLLLATLPSLGAAEKAPELGGRRSLTSPGGVERPPKSYLDCGVFEDIRMILSFSFGFFFMCITKALGEADYSQYRQTALEIWKGEHPGIWQTLKETFLPQPSTSVDQDGWALRDEDLDDETQGSDRRQSSGASAGNSGRGSRPSAPRTAVVNGVEAFKLYPFVM